MEVLEPSEWIPVATAAGVCTLLHIRILRLETSSRSTREITFTSNWMKILPIVTIISGMIHAFINTIGYFKFVCNISLFFSFLTTITAGCSMGFYQIARLYYCFSQSKVYNKYGYPQWGVYSLLFIIGVLLFIDFVMIPFLIHSPDIKCGINDKYQYYSFEDTIGASETISLWLNLALLCFAFWDITTLLLYAWKVFAMHRRKSNEKDLPKEAKEKIMSILNRIVILTLLYQIGNLIIFVNSLIHDNMEWEEMYALKWIPYEFGLVLISYSMFLMQSHNTKEYIKFLSVVYKYKLYWFGCCFCKGMIRNDLYSSNSMNSMDSAKQVESGRKETDITEFTKPGPVIQMPKLSIDTTFVE